MELGKGGHEGEPQGEESIEAWVLQEFGYGDRLDEVVGTDLEGAKVPARSFLDVYVDPERRQHTEDLLVGFQCTEPNDPDYEAARRHISRYLKAYFEPQITRTGGSSAK